MASVIAMAYVNCIKRGIRKIDDVRPDKLKEEVVGILVAEGLYDLAGVAKEEEPEPDQGEGKEVNEPEKEPEPEVEPEPEKESGAEDEKEPDSEHEEAGE